ncbi:UPF0149 family protein [Sphingomonas sp. H160509]|uniref:UPF0149 family protein n=1 Tax=Sphingomonas sp. H160509 TaxID=2955313 RepID=UPI00406CC922
MLLTELDGFLTGLVVGPDTIPQSEWLQSIWGSDDSVDPPFDDPGDVQWFVDAVMARYAEIVRDLTRGKPQPIFDTDDRNGEVLWEAWIDGFAEAVALRPESWTALGDGTDPDTANAVAQIMSLIAVVTNETELDSVEVNALDEHAPAQIVAAVPETPCSAFPKRGCIIRHTGGYHADEDRPKRSMPMRFGKEIQTLLRINVPAFRRLDATKAAAAYCGKVGAPGEI